MRVITLNINGIRAGARKGFFEWLPKQHADVICLQETKAQMEHLHDEHFRPKGYHCYYHDALKKGYSGVGIYSKVKPKNIITGLGWKYADEEGRYLQLDFDDMSIASLYLPSGSSGDERQAIKVKFLDFYEPILQKIAKSKHPFIICGDWNIVHKEIDIKNFKSNQKTSGCLPEERAWLDAVFTKMGWVDAFRVVNHEADQYTWWSSRGRAWENNVGWRIDYQIISPDLADKVQRVKIYKEQRFSDHAPLIIDYDVEM
ncbi:MAG: exodeoxyribonuclease III [Coxiella sp. RIFCSPHIGHO2_12_FULL_42_15]|nr:MAG: exodeoxyribonuclease III [Coxiella sp. RIFCSPHIGHO2_12_FULL_42_15]